MSIFLFSVILLIAGYFLYGAFVEKVFGASEYRKTPAIKYNDGVDYVPLPVWKVFLIQFLNIAGLGPVFGAVLGAVYGPVCLLWIVFGSIFAGGVHDYLSGMFSVRFKGKTMDFLVQKLISKQFAVIFMIFLVIILILVGAVFALNPAKMLADIFHSQIIVWASVIFGYYFLTTLLPVDKVIGRFYPVFALLLITVTVALLSKLFMFDHSWFAQMTFANIHPKSAPIFPLMFVTVACGAISGFHATQSPIMARCVCNEKQGRFVFYGAMILEGFIALVWATLGIAFYQNQAAYFADVTALGQGGVVAKISEALLGGIGAKLTVLSVVVLSITSGDTAFRAARLTIAEFLHVNQKNILKRLFLSILVLSAGISFIFVDITKLWMYFAWANQTLATITLWAVSIYLRRKNRFYFVSLIPALFMTMVSSTYILYQKIGFNMPLNYAKIAAAAITCTVLSVFLHCVKPKKTVEINVKQEIKL